MRQRIWWLKLISMIIETFWKNTIFILSHVFEVWLHRAIILPFFSIFWLNLLLSALYWFLSQDYHGRRLYSMVRETFLYNHLSHIMSRFDVYRGLSCKTTEKLQNDYYMKSSIKNGAWHKKHIFSKCIFDHAEQLLPL